MTAQLERSNGSLALRESQVVAGDGAGPGERAAEVASPLALARSVAHGLDAVRVAEPAHWDDGMAEMDRAWHAFRHAANCVPSRL